MSVLPSVTVCIPAFNAADYLAETVASVRQQDMADWECFIVNNGSTDQTGAVAEALAAEDPRIQVIHRSNEGGGGAARNVGCQRAHPNSKYFFALDSDDLLEPHALSTMSAYLNEHPNVGLIACQFQRLGPTSEDLGPGHRSRWIPSQWGWPRPLQPAEYETPFVCFFCATGQGPFAMFRQSTLKQTQLWDPQFTSYPYHSHEDTDIFCQMALLSAVHYLPDKLYWKREHPHQVTQTRLSAYSLFRQKWDTMQLSDPQQQALIDQSLLYYYRAHRPMRSLKVVVKALGDLVTRSDKRNPHHMSFTIGLLKSAVAGFVTPVHYQLDRHRPSSHSQQSEWFQVDSSS